MNAQTAARLYQAPGNMRYFVFGAGTHFTQRGVNVAMKTN
jgi:hypothetical protein